MSTPDPTEQGIFLDLWQRNLVNKSEDKGTEIYRQLVDAYNEPQRVYHTLDHIKHCLKLFAQVRDHLHNADALELAIWFHDAIYVPGASDNEQLSADWFMQATKNIFTDGLRTRVHDLIMVTLHCCNNVNNHDAQFMVDIDLSSFGMPWEQFAHDSDNVRKELPDMPDAEFYPKQCAFSKGLLDKPRFFQSDYFYRRYETQARKNLTDYYHLIEQKLAVSE